MKVERVFTIIIILVMIIFSGCSSKSEKKNNDGENIVMENPQITEDDYWGQDMFPGIVIETSGEGISAIMGKEAYSVTDETISVSLESDKKGTGFYFYGVPAIEKQQGNEWVRLGYIQSDPSREQWCICAIEDASDMNFSTRLSVDVDNISEELTEGNYRAVVFLSDRCLYVPFTVTGGSK